MKSSLLYSTRSAAPGFTLIELMVVIVIIAILATLGVGTFTSQLQKARDTQRTGGLEQINKAIVSYNLDNSEFPDTPENIKKAMTTANLSPAPVDPKSGQQSCGLNPVINDNVSSPNVLCDFVYGVGIDKNGIKNAAFELSTAFEGASNVTTIAGNDSDKWDCQSRKEVGSQYSPGTNSNDDNGGNFDTTCNYSTPIADADIFAWKLTQVTSKLNANYVILWKTFKWTSSGK